MKTCPVCKAALPDSRHPQVSDPGRFIPLPMLGCPAVPSGSYMLMPADMATFLDAEIFKAMKALDRNVH